MIQEKELMQTNGSADKYLAPSVKVKEIKNRRVLCASGGETEKVVEGGSLDEMFG